MITRTTASSISEKPLWRRDRVHEVVLALAILRVIELGVPVGVLGTIKVLAHVITIFAILHRPLESAYDLFPGIPQNHGITAFTLEGQQVRRLSALLRVGGMVAGHRIVHLLVPFVVLDPIGHVRVQVRGTITSAKRYCAGVHGVVR